jgi:hypothetical protein
MIVQLGSFDERNAGFKKFKDFVVEAERRNLVNTVDQDLELQVYLPDEKVPDLQDSDLASEEQKEDAPAKQPAARANGKAGRGNAAGRQEEKADFDLLEDLTPYELKTVCSTVAGLKQPASFVEIFSSIRELDERGELELSRDEIGEVISAMLEADFLDKVHQKPYEAAKAGMNLYALNADKLEVASALNGG